ncbi:MAG TPA: LLM class flavin-dependent oxidoreductase [Thermomicrobiales bacterium]|jgi:alkanesulfonate monooxygenase SsuD/methylene tetrahydromethanopterin reductase-like flavin-dependent oxidoreductase (luciferase family)
MRFGIMSFCRAPYEEIASRFRLAEELGFASAWVDDDILTPGYVDFEAWTLLAALARDTSRLRLGTLVAVPTFRHPSFLAAQVITLDHLSGGRAQLGFGAGGPPNNYGAVGQHEWPVRERTERFEEQAAILDRLLRGESVTFEGRHYRAHEAGLSAPVQRPRPPFVIAAHGERGLRVAARHADGWNSFGGQPYKVAQDPTKRVSLIDAVATTQQLNRRLDEICREVGRDPATLRRTVLAYRPQVDPLGSLDAFDEYVGRYREIGIDEVAFYWPPLDNIFPRRRGSADPEPVFDPPLPVSASQQATFERIAAERIAGG